MELFDWMKKNRWTARALAKELGCHANTLTYIRTKYRKPGLLLAKYITRFTNGEVTLEDMGFEINSNHLGCPAYPNCDENPIGCRILQGENVEMFGHKG